MPDYDYFLRGDPNVVLYQCVVISHPSFSKVHRYVRNNGNGVTLSIDGVLQFFEYCPIAVRKSNTGDDLDQSITIAVADLGEVFPQEIDNVVSGDKSNVKPVLDFYEFKSDNLSMPTNKILGLQVTDYQIGEEGAVFTCRAKQLNISKSGSVYSIPDFPTLRGVA